MLTFDAATHTYTFGGITRPSVTQVLSKLHSFGMVPADVLLAAQERGTAVHTLCQYHDENDLNPASVGELGYYLEAWVRFCADHEAEWSRIEHQGYSERFGFAGTMDRFGRLRGKPWVIDIKTSKASHPVWGMQTAAYRQLLVEQQEQGCLVARRGTVQLSGDGKYKLVEWTDPDDWTAFLSLIHLTNWSNKQ